MKKLLMPIFGGILLTSTASLATAQNVNIQIKLKWKQKNNNKKFLEQGYLVSSQSNLTKEQINHVQLMSKTWDTKAIDQILNQALEFNNGKLIVNKNKLYLTNLPSEVLQHIEVALTNLNDSITAGYIKVSIVNNVVKLIYPHNNKSLKNSNSDIIEFEKTNNKKLLKTGNSGFWITSYGPSHWWRFWEWGDYVHFNESWMNLFKAGKAIAEIISLGFLFSDILNLSKELQALKLAFDAKNSGLINDILKELSKLMGGINLDVLGNLSDVIALLGSIVILGLAIKSIETDFGPIGWAIGSLITSTITYICNSAINADYHGNGVKWQWANFIVPWGFSPE